jgi:hypothetical protein
MRSPISASRVGIQTLGLVVLIHQAFQLFQRAVEFGAGKRRGEVVENDAWARRFAWEPSPGR